MMARALAQAALPALLLSLSLVPGGAAVIGDPDRLTVHYYAVLNGLDPAEVEGRYAATGVVHCDWTDANGNPRESFSTGQVTGLPHLVTMSAHVFFDLGYCVAKADPEACTFTTEQGGVIDTVSITRIVDIGVRCGSTPSRGDTRRRLLNDWAIVRLDRPAAVTPYAVADASDVIAADVLVTSVVFSQDYLIPQEDGSTVHPVTIGTCTVRDVAYLVQLLVYFASDCDGAQRSSGGSILDDSAAVPVLLGIWAASTEDRAMLDEAVARMIEAGRYRDALANNGPYEADTWSSRHVPVTGAFLRALRVATELQ